MLPSHGVRGVPGPRSGPASGNGVLLASFSPELTLGEALRADAQQSATSRMDRPWATGWAATWLVRAAAVASHHAHTYHPRHYGDSVAVYWALLQGVMLRDVDVER